MIYYEIIASSHQRLYISVCMYKHINNSHLASNFLIHRSGDAYFADLQKM